MIELKEPEGFENVAYVQPPHICIFGAVKAKKADSGYWSKVSSSDSNICKLTELW